MVRISSGVCWRGTPGLNCAAISSRRSFAIMPTSAGRILAAYQGARSRRPRAMAGPCPARWYQMITMLWVNSAKGTVSSRFWAPQWEQPQGLEHGLPPGLLPLADGCTIKFISAAANLL